MKRDVLKLNWNETESLVIACDNSGALGEKQHDVVNVSYEIVGYFSFRVAAMECMAARATPQAVVIHNFNGDLAWEKLCNGIKKGMNELSLMNLPITGSTESNFSLLNSATGIIVIGRQSHRKVVEQESSTFSQTKVAVIGKPLVGQGVLSQSDKIAPLSVFRWCLEQPEIKTILPVGSKGILYELNQLYSGQGKILTLEHVSGEVDFKASSGPATCFIIRYEKDAEQTIKKEVGDWFHPIRIK